MKTQSAAMLGIFSLCWVWEVGTGLAPIATLVLTWEEFCRYPGGGQVVVNLFSDALSLTLPVSMPTVFSKDHSICSSSFGNVFCSHLSSFLYISYFLKDIFMH